MLINHYKEITMANEVINFNHNFGNSSKYVGEIFEILSQKLPNPQVDFKVRIEIENWNTNKKYGICYEVGNRQNEIKGDKNE